MAHLNLSDVESIFTKLAEQSAPLNTATDELNAAVNEIQKRLGRLNLGVQCYRTLPDNKTAIGYTRINGGWHIVIRYGTPDDFEEWHLLDNMSLAVAAVTERAKNKAEQSRAILDAMTSQTPTGTS